MHMIIYYSISWIGLMRSNPSDKQKQKVGNLRLSFGRCSFSTGEMCVCVCFFRSFTDKSIQ